MRLMESYAYDPGFVILCEYDYAEILDVPMYDVRLKL